MWFLNNREIIKSIALNTGTSQSAEWTNLCCTSEVEFGTEFEQKDFYVFCDAIQRHVLTGVNVQLETTVKFDINNASVQKLLGNVHTLLASGEIAQFNNQEVQYELLESVSSGVLTYKKYKVNATLVFSDLGGASEDEGEFGLTILFNGASTVVTP